MALILNIAVNMLTDQVCIQLLDILGWTDPYSTYITDARLCLESVSSFLSILQCSACNQCLPVNTITLGM